LEFEFFEEEGSGLGPTLEYYSLIANEISNPSYKLWRKTDDGSLFPTPFEPFRLYYEGTKLYKNQEHKQEHKIECEKLQLIFRMIGSVVARALLDERMVDIPLNRVFWNLVLKRVNKDKNYNGYNNLLSFL
jgi:E3 ubiquitin-protein ligase TRIP12